MKSDKKIAVVIFSLAFMTRLLFVLFIPSHPLTTDDKEYDRLGLSLSNGAGYVDPLGEPTAVRPPVYPFFLGMIYYIAGHNLFWVRFIQALLGAGICLLTYLIASVIFDIMTAIISGLIGCFYPPLIVQTSEIMSETLFIFLLLLGIWIMISKQSNACVMISGIIFGVGLLTRSTLVFSMPFLCYWIFLRHKSEFFKATMVFLAGVLLILFPWIFRNYSQLHSFVPLANIGGITFYNSYIVPDRGFGFTSLEGVDAEYYQIKSETERSHYLIKMTLEYIKKNPPKIIKLTALKILHFVYPFDGRWYSVSFGSKYNIFWGLIFCFSLIGIVNNIKDHDINKRLIFFLLISFLIGVVVFYGIPRFRLPAEPLLICFAASAIVRLFNKKKHAFVAIAIVNIILFVTLRFIDMQTVFESIKKWV